MSENKNKDIKKKKNIKDKTSINPTLEDFKKEVYFKGSIPNKKKETVKKEKNEEILDEKEVKNKINIIILLIIIFVLLILVILFYLSYSFNNMFFNSKTNKDNFFNKPLNQIPNYNKKAGESNFGDINWLAKVYYKEDYTKTSDNVNIHSYIIENPTNTNTWIILAHGYNSEGLYMTDISKYLYKMGYNVLILDFRGHGYSSDNTVSMGYLERLDIIAWVNYINKNYDNTKIILYGYGMGANASLLAAGNSYLSNVVGIISDTAFTSLNDEINYQLKNVYNLPYSPIIMISNLLNKKDNKYSINDVSPINIVKNIKVPILFIHGSNDTLIPKNMTEELYNKTTIEKEIFIIDNAKHSETPYIDQDKYFNKIKEFIQNK